MLRLHEITKTYITGDTTVEALGGVSVDFREHEFVSILGQSGCGKTTLLNIIGGLDQYTTGDLVISGRSTKQFGDGDWDTYRNHSVGFVFQSYNLIPHQTVLANVELALTLSGVSKAERRRRATEALERVGLGDQLKKKPNQMSGGQMQRVAIARALVNDPEILLADEPTGALDSETSVQIMEILREISHDKLIIMVTHNPDLAEEYSSRIIRLLDGKIIGDTAPFNADEESSLAADVTAVRRQKKPSMSFPTALSLSMNNLMTKRGRTLLTSFAGSIGIIGIALILSISTGVQAYIDRVQEDTLASYPIDIQAETVDMTSLVMSLMNTTAEEADDSADSEEIVYDRVYTSPVLYDLMNSMNNIETNKNNLSAFREHIESNPDFAEVLSAIEYNYAADINIFTENPEGEVILCDTQELIADVYAMGEEQTAGMNTIIDGNASAFAGMQTWQEMLEGENGEIVSDLLKTQYDILYGAWPQNYDEVVLFVNDRNEVSDLTLYTLGLKTADEVREIMTASFNQEEIDTSSLDSWSYEEICAKEFKLLFTADLYTKNADGTFTDLSQSKNGLDILYDSDRALDIKVVGIARRNPDAVSGMMTNGIGYTAALTEHVITASAESELIRAQLADETVDAITGLPFRTDDITISDAEKAEKIKAHFASLPTSEKAAIYTAIASVPTDDILAGAEAQAEATFDRDTFVKMMTESYAAEMEMEDTTAIDAYVTKMTDEELLAFAKEAAREQAKAQYAAQVEAQLGAIPAEQLAAMLDTTPYTETQYASFFDTYMPATYSESTYEENLKKMGYVTLDSPTSIKLYAATFADKDAIADLITAYNDSVEEADRIQYTDYVALMMSSITAVINAISYVLIAFVAISLVVSSIMIGIITYISVLERTKEIGILRAIGASKRDISRVFNAETLIVGFGAGAIGILFTLLALIPINAIIHRLTGIMILNAQLPAAAAFILVGISMFLTFIAGLIPSGVAAKKDPVVALRSE